MRTRTRTLRARVSLLAPFFLSFCFVQCFAMDSEDSPGYDWLLFYRHHESLLLSFIPPSARARVCHSKLIEISSLLFHLFSFFLFYKNVGLGIDTFRNRRHLSICANKICSANCPIKNATCFQCRKKQLEVCKCYSYRDYGLQEALGVAMDSAMSRFHQATENHDKLNILFKTLNSKPADEVENFWAQNYLDFFNIAQQSENCKEHLLTVEKQMAAQLQSIIITAEIPTTLNLEAETLNYFQVLKSNLQDKDKYNETILKFVKVILSVLKESWQKIPQS